jgi:hypothetical protein
MFGDKAGNRKYLKLDSEATVALVGEEVIGNAKFDSEKKRYVADEDGGFRFGVHAWDGSRVGMLEGGWRLYRALGGVVKARGQDVLIKVTKTGSNTDTQFSAEFVRELTPEEKEQIASDERYDLVKELSWAQARVCAAAGDDEVPF